MPPMGWAREQGLGQGLGRGLEEGLGFGKCMMPPKLESTLKHMRGHLEESWWQHT
jgi:hypothetical protein